MLLGHRDEYFVQLAELAAAATVLVSALATATYLLIYRRFDWYMLRPAADAGRAPCLRAHENEAFAAVRDFTSATLRRSALHQNVLLGLAAGGVSLALGILLGNGALAWMRAEQPLAANLLGAIAGMPFPLIAVLGVAAKASLVLPIEPRANWVFRLTEHRGARADQLRIAERVVTVFAALIPAALTLPLHWAVAGSRAVAAAALNAAIGLLWTEALLRDWRRIPFTCSYAPGKRSVAQSTLFAVSIFPPRTVGGLILTVEPARRAGHRHVSKNIADIATNAVATPLSPASSIVARPRKRWRSWGVSSSWGAVPLP